MLTGLKEERLTYHHIVKKDHGGDTTAQNGAALVQIVHQWLHNQTERHDPATYALITDCLSLYKQCIILNKQELVKMYEEEIMPLCEEEVNDYRRIQELTKRQKMEL